MYHCLPIELPIEEPIRTSKWKIYFQITFACSNSDFFLQNIVAATKVIAVSEKNAVKLPVCLFRMDLDFIPLDSVTPLV